jgi:hypothetical protein
MKLKIRKIKDEGVLNKKPTHLVDLKIFKNQKKNQSTDKQTNPISWQKKIKNKNILSFLEYFIILFQKISNEFAQYKEALFFYNKKFFIWFKKINFKFYRDALQYISILHLIKFIFIKIKNQYHVIFSKLHSVISTLNKTQKHKNIKTQEYKNTKIQEYKNTRKLTNKYLSFFKKNYIKPLLSNKIHFIKSRKAEIPLKTELFNWIHYIKSNETNVGQFNKVKPILIFILIAFVFVLSLHILFLTQKNKSIESLHFSKKKLNISKYTPLNNKYLTELTNNINLSDFISNQSKFNQIINLLPANSKNRALLKAEKNLSEAEKNLIAILDNKETKKEILTEQIINFQNNLLITLPKIQLANFYLTQVNLKTIPIENKNEFNQIKIYFSKLDNNIKELLDYSKILLQILGHEKKQRYLIVFQNDNKIRPTGGLIENFILIDVNHGVIKKVDIDSVRNSEYLNLDLSENKKITNFSNEIKTQNFIPSTDELKNNFKNLIQPPYPLNLISPAWQKQDANWFFDFPTSAQKIIWFYEKFIPKLADKKINGVISLNTSLIPEILKITKSIKMPEYSVTVNSENFSTIMLREKLKNIRTEEKTQNDQNSNTVLFDSQENITSNFIADFIPELLNKILSPQNSSEQSLKTLEILNEALFKKNIMFYFNNPDLQKDILKNNWAGEIKSINNGDYLAVINANINGESDENIKQSVDLQTQILDDGTIINTTKITRTSFKNKFTNLKNLNYIKIYVPRGSVLLDINGFKKNPLPLFRTSFEEYLMDEDLLKIQKQTLIDETTNTRISQEFNKTVFSNWIEVEPKKSATITFKYKLPFKLEDLKTNQEPQGFLQNFYKKIAKKFNLINETLPYQFLIQKQSGKKDEIWKYSINLPVDWQLAWQNFPIDFIEKNGQIEFNSTLNQDQLWLMLLKK